MPKKIATFLLTVLLAASAGCGRIETPRDPSPVPPAATATEPPTPQPTRTPTPPPATQTPIPDPRLYLAAVWPEGDTKIVGAVAASDGTIYAVDLEGVLYALSASGNILWEYRGKYEYVSPPLLAFDEDLIYVVGGSRDSESLITLDKEGQQISTFEVKSPMTSLPKISPDGSVYVQTRFRDDRLKLRIDRLMRDGTQDSFVLPLLTHFDDSIFDDQGNIIIWDYQGMRVLSPQGEPIQECKGDKDHDLTPGIIAGPEGTILYSLGGGSVGARRPDCSTVWENSMKAIAQNKANAQKALRYHLFYDRDTVYVSVGSGGLYALEAGSGKLLWQGQPDLETGQITSLARLDDGLVYAGTARGKLVAFTPQGKRISLGEFFGPGQPFGFYGLPENRLMVLQDNHILFYDPDPLVRYEFPSEIQPPASQQDAEDEIVSFILDFIVKSEIQGTADYVNHSGQAWVDAAPEANIIVYAPALKAPDESYRFVDADNPITVWMYEDGKLAEVTDMKKAIGRYQRTYMDNPPSDIFAWGAYDFGIVKIDPRYGSAMIYVGASCGPLCGHGYYYFLQRSPSGKWWIYDSERLWVS